MLEKHKKQKYNKKQDNKVKWVKCVACGYEGSLDDFLAEDSGDTICPKCNEDIQRYDL